MEKWTFMEQMNIVTFTVREDMNLAVFYIFHL